MELQSLKLASYLFELLGSLQSTQEGKKQQNTSHIFSDALSLAKEKQYA